MQGKKIFKGIAFISALVVLVACPRQGQVNKEPTGPGYTFGSISGFPPGFAVYVTLEKLSEGEKIKSKEFLVQKKGAAFIPYLPIRWKLPRGEWQISSIRFKGKMQQETIGKKTKMKSVTMKGKLLDISPIFFSVHSEKSSYMGRIYMTGFEEVGGSLKLETMVSSRMPTKNKYSLDKGVRVSIKDFHEEDYEEYLLEDEKYKKYKFINGVIPASEPWIVFAGQMEFTLTPSRSSN